LTAGIVLRFRRPVNQNRDENDAVWHALAKACLIGFATSHVDAVCSARPHNPPGASAKKKGGPFGRLFLFAHGTDY
jgi:hypothetical protein